MGSHPIHRTRRGQMRQFKFLRSARSDVEWHPVPSPRCSSQRGDGIKVRRRQYRVMLKLKLRHYRRGHVPARRDAPPAMRHEPDCAQQPLVRAMSCSILAAIPSQCLSLPSSPASHAVPRPLLERSLSHSLTRGSPCQTQTSGTTFAAFTKKIWSRPRSCAPASESVFTI